MAEGMGNFRTFAENFRERILVIHTERYPKNPIYAYLHKKLAQSAGGGSSRLRSQRLRQTCLRLHGGIRRGAARDKLRVRTRQQGTLTLLRDGDVVVGDAAVLSRRISYIGNDDTLSSTRLSDVP